jgi:hypothetical protein
MNPLLTRHPVRHQVAEHHLLGASTGYMADQRGDWQNLIERASETTPRAVELSALSGPELEPLLEYLEGLAEPLPFIYVSVHGPAKQMIVSESKLVEELNRLPTQVQSVVLHPDVLTDIDALRPLGPLVVLENMDHRSATARTVSELVEFFDVLPEAGFCLDVAHITAIDPEMGLAHELLDAFGGRLREVHISSFERDVARHVPLADRDIERFAPVLKRCSGVPWILEAPLPGLDA